MLQRQSLWLRPRLNALDRPSPLSFVALHDPQIDRRPAAVGRRWLASASAEPVSTPIHSFEQARREQGYLYPRDRPASEWPSALESLLDAIRRHDENAILVRFFRWEQSLRHGDSQIREAARKELQELPSSTFSEILRFIDPVKNPHIDIAYGLNLTIGQAQTTNASVLLNRYGVRKRADKLLRAVEAVCEARLASGVGLLAPDYEVLLRCAGAASNISASLRTFTMMSRAGLAAKQNTSTWVEFLKARFLIDPQYYQWDRARVVVNARQLVSNKEPAEPTALWKLERIRFSRNALLVWPYSRQPGKERQELRMRLRKKRGHTSTHEHWFLAKVGGVLVNEELLCASMISFARSGSLVLIKGIVLRRGFRIKMKEDPETGEVTIWGGKRFREGSPRQPTAKFLDAIVESFGSMSRIQVGLKLLIYVSQKYEIPIPHTTWSNLLQWTYVCSTKPFSSMAKNHQDYPVRHSSYKHVLAVWSIMTSAPFNVQPTIDDYSCYIKALIRGQRLKEAIAIIRNDVIPYYRGLEEGHFESITNDILKSRVRASKDRLEMEALKEYTWFHIHSWLRKILRTASSNSRLRNEIFMEVHVPNLVHEFSDFFHKSISYRTAQGYVTLHRPNAVKRFDYVPEYRRTLPQAYGGNMMRSLVREEGDSTERPPWRDVRQMRILQWSRKPRKRVRVTGRPPQAGDVDARKWWRTLEQELMT